MRSANDIAAEYAQRRTESAMSRGKMVKVRDTYNGDLVVPVEGATEPAVANLILTGIDQTAGRIASVLPDIISEPLRPGIKDSERRADLRRDVWMAWWKKNRMPLKMHYRARYLIAYGSAPVVMGVDFDKQRPTWRVRDPLDVYPSEATSDEVVPRDAIIAVRRNAKWVKDRYQASWSALKDATDTQEVTLLEYIDAEQRSLVLFTDVTSGFQPVGTPFSPQGSVGGVLLEQVPNRLEMPLVVMPQRITLDRLQGQFDQMVGQYEAGARLSALSMIATEKNVFPDQYLVSRQGELGEFVQGPFDGRTGQVNVIRGGDIREVATGPGFNTNPAIDRLERSQRVTASVPSEFGGESQTNIRTGRRGDAILSATIDFPIMEAQQAFAEALTYENKIAAKIAKTYFGNRTLSVACHYDNGKPVGQTYTPNTAFDTVVNEVSYPVTGADMNSLIVGMGQRIGLGTMSKETAAELDPLIDNPEQERDRITAESLDTAVLASLQQATQSGQMPPQVIARVAELVKQGKVELVRAVEQATKEYQANQQAQSQQVAEQAGMQGAPPGMLGAPPAMPGEAVPTVAETPQGQQNLAGLLTSLRKTSGSGRTFSNAMGAGAGR